MVHRLDPRTQHRLAFFAAAPHAFHCETRVDARELDDVRVRDTQRFVSLRRFVALQYRTDARRWLLATFNACFNARCSTVHALCRPRI